jgi:hypothetical protein
VIRLRLAIAALFVAAGGILIAPAFGWLSSATAETLFVCLWLFGGLPVGAWLLWTLARRK